MLRIFDFLDYKQLLIELIEENRALGNTAFKAKLAKAASCQRSFFSRVINAHVHLTLDHAYGIAKFLNLTEAEQEYFMSLVEYARAGNYSYKSSIKNKLEKIKSSNEKLNKVLKKESNEQVNKFKSLFWSNWIYQAIVLLIEGLEFRTVDSLSNRLQLSSVEIKKYLKVLQEMGLVVVVDSRVEPVEKKIDIHISNQSEWVLLHQAWRNLAILDSHDTNKNNIHYTAIHMTTVAEFDRLKSKILKLIDESRQRNLATKDEELVCFNCDLFVV